MKKLLLLLPACAILAFSSCKKSSTKPANTTGTITVTIDGAKQTFNVGATAHLDNTGGFYELGILGVQSSSATNSLIIDVSSSDPIAAGKTYTSASTEAAMSYELTTGAVYQFDGTNNSSGDAVTITSISSTNVQGTFSGTLDLISGSGAATKTFTNGTFNLNITH